MGVSKVIYGTTTLIDLTSDTVEADKLLSDYTAHGADGEAITGTCTYDADTSDADATASEILATKTAYVNGEKLEGTMTNNGAWDGVITTIADPLLIPQGYHDGTGEVTVDSVEQAKLIPVNIRSGVEILGVTGSYEGEAMPTQAKTATPLTTSQVILPDEGYDLSQVTIEAIAYEETENAGGGLTVTIGTVASA